MYHELHEPEMVAAEAKGIGCNLGFCSQKSCNPVSGKCACCMFTCPILARENCQKLHLPQQLCPEMGCSQQFVLFMVETDGVIRYQMSIRYQVEILTIGFFWNPILKPFPSEQRGAPSFQRLRPAGEALQRWRD